ncbi:MAG TPA: CDP-alcohol phosphatidyltransferase family protein [Chthoniobacterales bacterium]|nr:CDP-alcohol phosphatidyltransferase family protein [Chthoniobacterales bacterium]
MECVLFVESSKALVELCGISIIERALRTLQICEVTRAYIIADNAPALTEHLRNPSPQRAQVACVFSEPPRDGQLRLVARGDSVFDPRLFGWLLARETSTVLTDAGKFCETALARASSTDVLHDEKSTVLDVSEPSWYVAGMRRTLRPYWFPAPNESQKHSAEHAILDAAQKGTLDIPALVHAPIETFIVSKLCRTSVTPNQLTVFSNIVAWGATILFASGHLGWGIAVALIVGVLDGLDGKLARVKLETSKAGELEHFFDVLFENSWWIAIAYHLHVSGKLPNAFWFLALLLIAEVFAGLARGSIVRYFGKSISELGRFDRLVRLIGGRRNVYVWILALGIALGAPAFAFKLVAWWEVATAAVHWPSAAWALWMRARQSAR